MSACERYERLQLRSAQEGISESFCSVPSMINTCGWTLNNALTWKSVLILQAWEVIDNF